MKVHVDEINTNNLCIFVLYRQRGTESAKVEVGIYQGTTAKAKGAVGKFEKCDE